MSSETFSTMMFHTALRNIGLFTSISFAALGYSRFYRGKIHFYNLFLIACSLMFILCSLLMNWFLIQDYSKLLEKSNSESAKKWITIPYIVIVFNFGIFCLGLLTLLREIST